MGERTTLKICLVSCLIALIVIQPTGRVVGQEGPFAEIKATMASISEAERENLQNLFILEQQIQEMEKEGDRITRDIEAKNREIEGLKVSIAEEELAYSTTLEDLKQVLKSYQRMGPGTYVEIILSSDNLTMLLRRINTLRDFTRNTEKLMDSLEERKARLITKKTNLTEKIILMQDNRKQFQESLTKKKHLVEEQENYLGSLKEKKEFYRDNLTNLQQNWDELKTSVPEIIKELSRVIDEGTIPPEKLNIFFSLTSIRGSVDEETINELISEDPLLPKIVFNFYPDNVEISLPEKNLVLSGFLVIQEKHTLKFQVQEGRFFGMPLDTSGLEDLFLNADLVFNLKLPLGNYTFDSIKITDDYFEWTITPKY